MFLLLAAVGYGSKSSRLVHILEELIDLEEEHVGARSVEEESTRDARASYVEDPTHDERTINGHNYGLFTEALYTDWRYHFEYFAGDYGKRCADYGGQEIANRHICDAALIRLGFNERSSWSGYYDGVPSGCSFRESDGKQHLNSYTKGRGRSRGDLRPICIKQMDCSGLRNDWPTNQCSRDKCYSCHLFGGAAQCQRTPQSNTWESENCKLKCCELYNDVAKEGGKAGNGGRDEYGRQCTGCDVETDHDNGAMYLNGGSGIHLQNDVSQSLVFAG